MNAVMPLIDYVSACDKIREKTGETELIKSGELAEKIDDVYKKGTEAGAESSDKVFFDLFTAYGKRPFYGDAFRQSSFEYIRPTYKIVPTEAGSALRTFTSCKSLKKLEAEYFDFSQIPKGSSASGGFYNTFSTCSVLEEIEDIGIENQKYFNSTFSRDYVLKKIARIGVDEDSVFSGAFYACEKLEDVTFDGVIGTNGLSFSSSPLLTEATLRNIVGCLKDVKGNIINNYTYTFTDSQRKYTIGQGTLASGKEYRLDYSAVDYGDHQKTATVKTITLPSGENVTGLQYDFSHPAGETYTFIKYIYQDGNNIVIYDEEAQEGNLITVSLTEPRTITFHADSVAKLETLTEGGQTLKQIANDKGWTVVES